MKGGEIMKKKAVYLMIVLFSSLLMGGCAGTVSPVTGFIYTGVKGPVTTTETPAYSKIGTASCISILGLVAIGDASIETAAKKGGITKIHHIDHESTSIFGFYAKYEVYVYGE